jgi:CxxC motif-containing protein
MKKQLFCVVCPVGCLLDVEIVDGECLSISGHGCPRGEAYARQECLEPARMVSTSILIPGRILPLSVRTDRPLPKDKIMDCLQEIGKISPCLPVKVGDILLADVLKTGVNIIATRNYS